MHSRNLIAVVAATALAGLGLSIQANASVTRAGLAGLVDACPKVEFQTVQYRQRYSGRTATRTGCFFREAYVYDTRGRMLRRYWRQIRHQRQGQQGRRRQASECKQRKGPYATQRRAYEARDEAKRKGYEVSKGVWGSGGLYRSGTRGYYFNIFYRC